MTDEERFEELAYNVGISLDGEKAMMSSDDYDFLYNYALEQAERVQELELEINDWREEVQKWQQFYKESEESHSETKELLRSTIRKNKRYKQALEEISKVGWSDSFGGGFSYTGENHTECVKIAKQALEGEK